MIEPRLYPGLPLLGAGPAFLRAPLKVLERAHRVAGGLAILKLGPVTMWLVTDHELAREVLLTDDDTLNKSAAVMVHARPLVGQGLLSSHGDQHHRDRALVGSVMGADLLQLYRDTVIKCLQPILLKWQRSASTDIAEDMRTLAAATHVRVLLGESSEAVSRSIADATDVWNVRIARHSRLLVHPPLSWPLPGNHRARQALRTLHEAIDRALADLSPSTSVAKQLVIEYQQKFGRPAPRQWLMDHLSTLLITGQESLASMWTWMWRLLAEVPEVETQLRDELVAQKAGGAQPEFRWTRAVIEETLRLYPPAFLISRTCREPVSIAGLKIPRGNLVAVNVFGIHRRPDYFAQPSQFVPSRWLEEAAGPPRADGPQPSEMPPRAKRDGGLLAFGIGARACVGGRIAVAATEAMLAAILPRFRFEVFANQPLPTAQAAVSLKPKGPVHMQINSRIALAQIAPREP